MLQVHFTVKFTLELSIFQTGCLATFPHLYSHLTAGIYGWVNAKFIK